MLEAFRPRSPHAPARARRYQLLLEDGRKFVAAARRRKAAGASRYDVTTSPSAGAGARFAPGCAGKLRANFVGTEFVMVDAGAKPGAPFVAGAAPRRELAAVMYEPNLLGTKGPRRMLAGVPLPEGGAGGGRGGAQARAPARAAGPHAACRNHLSRPRPNPRRTVVHTQPADAAAPLLERVKASVADGAPPRGLLVLRNKAPKWSEAMKAFCLNFGGRVSVASVKNFQLVSLDDPEAVLLQFGKAGDDAFTCDFRWPLTAGQAFGICLSSFDSKLACE